MSDTVSSQRMLTVAAVALVAVLITAAIRFAPKESLAPKTVIAPIAEPSTFFSETDTDGDSVPDWQEALMGTDPEMFDEIALGNGTSGDTLPTATDAVGERLIQQYLFLKESQSYTEERGERLGASLAANVYVPTPFVPYTQSELRTTEDQTKEAVTAYRASLQDVLEPFLTMQTPEVVLYAQFVDSKDPHTLIPVRERALVYKQVAKHMMELTVPNDAAALHVETANALAFFGTVLEYLVQYAQDPIASLSLLKTYNEAERYVFTTFSALSTYYNTHI